MTHDLVRRPAFLIAGFSATGEDAAEAWARLQAELPRLFRVIDPHRLYGVSLPQDPACPERSRFVAGAEVASDEDLPEGFELVRIPDRIYAVKVCEGPADRDKALRDLHAGMASSHRERDETAPALEVWEGERVELWEPLA
jgi:predicted transcriptional regulator YdeE